MTRLISAEEISSSLGGSAVGRREWKCRCPAHDDSTPSLWVKDSDDGKVLLHCFGGCSQNAVIEALRERGLWGGSGSSSYGFSKLPSGIAHVWPRSYWLRKQGQEPSPENQKLLTKLYRYISREGVTLGFAARYEGHGKKDVIPYFRIRDGRWSAGHEFKTGRPLYGLQLMPEAEEVERDVTLLVVEGEKTADAVNSRTISETGLAALSWPGGCKSVKKASFEPIASWWRIVLCPDFDAAGFRAMADVASQLVAAGFSGELMLLDPRSLLDNPQEGWDLADLPLERRDALCVEFLEPLFVPTDASKLRALARELFPSTAARGPEEPVVDGPEIPQGKRVRMSSSGGFPHTDVGNGARFVRDHGENVRFAEDAGWFVWNGKVWVRDTRSKVIALAGETGERICDDAEGLKAKDARPIIRWAQASCMMPRINAMLAAARASLSVGFDEFDADPWLLNVRNGVVDLRTGELRPHDRKLLMTKIIDVDYDLSARSPLWDQFLSRIMEQDRPMIEFLKRAVGYSLTGITSEQVMFLLWGHTGSNGKSVFCETLKHLWGDYATQTGCELVLKDRFGQASAPNTVARLKGARLVIGNELPEGGALNEARIKEMTGEDTMSARFLYREHFEFRPRFKLWLRTNHRPEVHGTDGGIWRRLMCIPFKAVITEAEKDRHLQGKLLQELPGILAWAVQGCLEWQKKGLSVPEAVSRETSVYRRDMDAMADWIEDCAVVDRNASVACSLVYASYVEWCKFSGERAVSQRQLSVALRERGFLRKRSTGGQRHYVGLTLKSEWSVRNAPEKEDDDESDWQQSRLNI